MLSAKTFQPQIVIYWWVILSIIFGEVHQFIGHCLISLAHWLKTTSILLLKISISIVQCSLVLITLKLGTKIEGKLRVLHNLTTTMFSSLLIYMADFFFMIFSLFTLYGFKLYLVEHTNIYKIFKLVKKFRYLKESKRMNNLHKKSIYE